MLCAKNEDLSATEEKARDRLIEICTDIFYDFGNDGE